MSNYTSQFFGCISSILNMDNFLLSVLYNRLASGWCTCKLPMCILCRGRCLHFCLVKCIRVSWGHSIIHFYLCAELRTYRICPTSTAQNNYLLLGIGVSQISQLHPLNIDKIFSTWNIFQKRFGRRFDTSTQKHCCLFWLSLHQVVFPTRLHVHQRMNANGTSTKWFIFLKQ